MLPIPPLASAAYGATQVQRQTEEKIAQVRSIQARAKDAANHADRYEHSVESSDEVQAIHDEETHQQPKQSKHQHKPDHDADDEDGGPLLDLTA